MPFYRILNAVKAETTRKKFKPSQTTAEFAFIPAQGLTLPSYWISWEGLEALPYLTPYVEFEGGDEYVRDYSSDFPSGTKWFKIEGSPVQTESSLPPVLV